MAATENNVSQSVLPKVMLFAVIWGTAALAVLQLRNWTGPWDHLMCGVWGCAPPLAAMVSCHCIWALALFPAAVAIRKYVSAEHGRVTAISLMLIAICMIIGMISYEFVTWYLPARESIKPFFLRRLGIAVLGQVDIPAFELFFCGLLLKWFPRRNSNSATVRRHDDIGSAEAL